MSLRIIFLLVFLCNSKSEDVTLMPKISGPETVIEGEFISYYCDYESEIETTSSSTLELVVTSRDDGVIDGTVIGEDFQALEKYGALSAKCVLIKDDQTIESESETLETSIKYVKKLRIEAPRNVNSNDQVNLTCQAVSSFPELILNWKVNRVDVAATANQEVLDEDDSNVYHIISKITIDANSENDQINVICFWDEAAMENQIQKIIKISGKGSSKADEVWRVVERESVDEDFDIPEGFEFVDINEQNFRNYVSKIKDLLTEEIGGKLPLGLVGFVKSDKVKEPIEPKEVWKVVQRESIDEEFDIPFGFELVDVNEENFINYVSKISHLLTEEMGTLLPEGLIGFVRSQSTGGDLEDSDKVDESSSEITRESQSEEFAVSQGYSSVSKTENNISDDINENTSKSVECINSDHQCCPDDEHPQHGPGGLGCCAASEFGCCPDNLTPASSPFLEGCDCSSTEFGCCPDEMTPARGQDLDGCGCQYQEHGCCPDHQTPAQGPHYEGCPCHTHPNGCCPDGESIAQGPNMEGCYTCDSYEFGCCEDGLTPASGKDFEGCGCESSVYGCCLDGSTATGDNFMGCKNTPGEFCHLPSEMGPCTDYTDKWFYDMKYGGCARFWFGGCEPGKNHFDSQEDCSRECVEPRGSAVCFLLPLSGPCKGAYDEWYYDTSSQTCRPFIYGGCLGNGNRFSTKEECESLCWRKPEVPVCSKPKAEGACLGDFPRWYFDKKTGECQEFSYTGCMGNNNRFMTLDECQATCLHVSIRQKSDETCDQLIDQGRCEDGLNATLPRWGYNRLTRRCVPFYFTGCGGNENNFESMISCEEMCPTTFSPVITFIDGNTIFVNRNQTQAKISVSVRANPGPKVQWNLNGRNISRFDTQFKVLEDFSLLLKSPKDYNAGKYTIIASNGIGAASKSSANVIIYPILPSISLETKKNIYEPKSDAEFTCKVKMYPTTRIRWTKKIHRDPETEIIGDRQKFIIDSYQESQMSLVSRLVIHGLQESDSAVYSCQVGDVSKKVAISVQYGPDVMCVDKSSFAHCKLVVRNRFCGNKYYGRFCCRSCTESGQIPGGQL